MVLCSTLSKCIHCICRLEFHTSLNETDDILNSRKVGTCKQTAESCSACLWQCQVAARRAMVHPVIARLGLLGGALGSGAAGWALARLDTRVREPQQEMPGLPRGATVSAGSGLIPRGLCVQVGH